MYEESKGLPFTQSIKCSISDINFKLRHMQKLFVNDEPNHTFCSQTIKFMYCQGKCINKAQLRF